MLLLPNTLRQKAVHDRLLLGLRIPLWVNSHLPDGGLSRPATVSTNHVCSNGAPFRVEGALIERLYLQRFSKVQRMVDDASL